jgi:hypothetical protein
MLYKKWAIRQLHDTLYFAHRAGAIRRYSANFRPPTVFADGALLDNI